MEDGIMAEKNLEQRKEQTEPIIIDGKEIDNVKTDLDYAGESIREGFAAQLL